MVQKVKPIQAATIQAKHWLNRPGDRFEQEADAMAEKLLHVEANTNPLQTGVVARSIQRKCAHCEEEESKKNIIRRKENGNTHETPSTSFITKLNATLGQGNPLPKQTLLQMEQFFGNKLEQVRIHTDQLAHNLSNEINAQAFTLGNDIYFNKSTYNPDSYEGKKLLAHELTHVVQQSNGPLIKRQVAPPTVPHGFEINEARIGAANTNIIYFDRNSKKLEPEQQMKILGLAGPGSTLSGKVELNGFCSEDEPPTLAAERIDTVAAEMNSYKSFTSTITKSPNPDAGQGRADYRSIRSVEVLDSSKKSTTPDCKKTPSVITCPKAVESKFQSSLVDARRKISKTTTLLTQKPMAAGTELLLDRYFGQGVSGEGKKVLPLLLSNLEKIRKQIWRIKDVPHHQCANNCDSVCDSGAIAYNNDVGKSATYTICPPFRELDEPNTIRNMIHECAHATDELQTDSVNKAAGTDDFAYRHERLIGLVEPSVALKNSDSYSLLIMYLNDSSFKTQVPANDDQSGISDATEKRQAYGAIAHLEKWLTFAQQECGSLHGVIHESKAPTASWSNAYYEKTMEILADRFSQLTKPPAIPNLSDQILVAGIADRMDVLRSGVREDLQFKRKAGRTIWERSGKRGRNSIGTEVKFGDDFYSAASDTARSEVLLKKLLSAYLDIPLSLEDDYFDIILKIKNRH